MNLPLPNMVTIVAMIGGFSLLGAIALFIHHIIEREKRIEEKEKKTLEQYEDIIKKAHQQAADLLDKTSKEAEQIINQVKSTHDELNKHLDKVLSTMADKEIASLEVESQNFRKDYEGKILKMQIAIEENTKMIIQKTQESMSTGLENFAKSISEKTSSTAEHLDKQTADLLVKAQKDIEDYKKGEIEKIDNAVIHFVQKTCQDVLGVSLPPEIHKEIIMNALEKSKKEGVFDV